MLGHVIMSSYTFTLLVATTVVCNVATTTAADEDQASFQVTCDGNVAIQPPPGTTEYGRKRKGIEDLNEGEERLLKCFTSTKRQHMNCSIACVAMLTASILGSRTSVVGSSALASYNRIRLYAVYFYTSPCAKYC